MIDKDEYPATAEVERRCTEMIADLWNAPVRRSGCRRQGSSEACMMGGLAFQKRWQAARRAAGCHRQSPTWS